jgi:hypothetical protein
MTTTPQRPALRAMYAGLVLTVIATIAPYVDRATSNVLAEHIRNGYPAFSQGRIDAAVSTWLVILSVVGVVGVACWLWTIRGVTTGPAGRPRRCSCSGRRSHWPDSLSRTRPATPAWLHCWAASDYCPAWRAQRPSRSSGEAPGQGVSSDSVLGGGPVFAGSTLAGAFR